MRDFPRFSPGGLLILAVYLSANKTAFDRSIYGPSLLSGALSDSSSVGLNGAVAATSLLNALSHSAVVLGALHDTYALSILAGVGFDVATRVLYLIWWARLSAIAFRFSEGEGEGEAKAANNASTISFLVVLAIAYAYHMVIHVRALRMRHHSYERAMGILGSALNNLRGVAGEGFEDHVFAYSDLGSHLAPLHLSADLLHRQRGGMLAGLWFLLLLVLSSGLVLSSVPINRYGNDSPSVNISSSGRIDCGCRACKTRLEATGERSSFTFTMKEGVCHLWLHSFEDLSNVLRNACRSFDKKAE